MQRRTLPDLLIASDLHLGIDHSGERVLQFATWLHQLRTEVREGRHWRLLLVGDTFDFLELPTPGGEQSWQKPPGAREALLKFRRILQASAPAIEALGCFIRDGNEVHFVVGNHDRELLIRPVKRMLRRELRRAAGFPRYRRMRKQVVIHPWFYLEPGVLYVEHGHQFDPYTCYTEVLELCNEDDEVLPEEPVAHQAVRHFVYETGDLFDTSKVDYWTFHEYIAWGLRVGINKVGWLLSLYLRMLFMIVVTAAYRVPRRVVPSSRVSRALLGQARRYGLELRIVKALRRLHCAPARAMSVLRCFLGDRLLMIAGGGLLSGSFVVHWGLTLYSGIASGIVWGVVVAMWMHSARRRKLDLTGPLRRKARQIQALVGVPIVVFGHTHVRIQESIANGKGLYLNPGGWGVTGERLGTFVLHRVDGGRLRLAKRCATPSLQAAAS